MSGKKLFNWTYWRGFKARDYYDVLWLMQKQIMPLSEKLSSDGKKPYTLSSAINLLQQNIQKIKLRIYKKACIHYLRTGSLFQPGVIHFIKIFHDSVNIIWRNETKISILISCQTQHPHHRIQIQQPVDMWELLPAPYRSSYRISGFTFGPAIHKINKSFCPAKKFCSVPGPAGPTNNE